MRKEEFNDIMDDLIRRMELYSSEYESNLISYGGEDDDYEQYTSGRINGLTTAISIVRSIKDAMNRRRK